VCLYLAICSLTPQYWCQLSSVSLNQTSCNIACHSVVNKKFCLHRRRFSKKGQVRHFLSTTRKASPPRRPLSKWKQKTV